MKNPSITNDFKTRTILAQIMSNVGINNANNIFNVAFSGV